MLGLKIRGGIVLALLVLLVFAYYEVIFYFANSISRNVGISSKLLLVLLAFSVVVFLALFFEFFIYKQGLDWQECYRDRSFWSLLLLFPIILGFLLSLASVAYCILLPGLIIQQFFFYHDTIASYACLLTCTSLVLFWFWILKAFDLSWKL